MGVHFSSAGMANRKARPLDEMRDSEMQAQHMSNRNDIRIWTDCTRTHHAAAREVLTACENEINVGRAERDVFAAHGYRFDQPDLALVVR